LDPQQNTTFEPTLPPSGGEYRSGGGIHCAALEELEDETDNELELDAEEEELELDVEELELEPCPMACLQAGSLQISHASWLPSLRHLSFILA